MQKLLAIIWKENYERFTDRTGFIFNFAAPLVLATVIGLAFSGIASGSSDVPTLNIPVGIVNLDEGSDQFSYGDIFVQQLVPDEAADFAEDNPLLNLFDAQEFTDEAEARALVERGELTAILIIPADFSQSLQLDQDAYMRMATGNGDDTVLTGHVELTLFWNSASQIGWSIFRDVVQQFADGIATGNIAVNTTVSGFLEANPLTGLQLAAGAYNDTFADVVTKSSQPGANPIHLKSVNVEGEQQEVDIFSFFAPGITVFFVAFAISIGSASMLQERRDWTLQRMVTTPTSRATILVGKMVGNYIGGVLQLVVLILSITAISSAVKGQFSNVWGTDILGIALITLTVVGAGTGLGTILAGIARTFDQAVNMSSVVLVVMGMISGTFFETAGVPVIGTLAKFTFHYWGAEGFTTLGTGGTLADVLPNIMVLIAMTIGFFGIGLYLFNKRLDI